MILGAHTSISGGLYRALERGQELGCAAVQIFSKNQQQWTAKPLTNTDVSLFQRARSETGVRRVIVHDSYLINLGHPDDEPWRKSLEAFRDELRRADALGAEVLVFHPGASLRRSTDEQCCDRVAQALNEVLEAYDGACLPAIENTAGQGSNIGWRFEHLARILEGVKQRHRVATCFDTAHAFAAGYDLRDEAAFGAAFAEYDCVVGIERHLRAFHINDSKVALGSRVDRHENLGFGWIGEECFRLLARDERFAEIPGVLETPVETHGGHERDLARLLELREANKPVSGPTMRTPDKPRKAPAKPRQPRPQKSLLD